MRIMNISNFPGHPSCIRAMGSAQVRALTNHRVVRHLIAAFLYIATAVLLFLSAPHNGEFWWSDAPRHALNGVFIRDMLAALPWRDPVGFATQYYGQYPALTILFYPPLFYIVSALFYAAFGVSKHTAFAVVLVYYVAFAYGLFLLARRWLSHCLASVVGLLVLSVCVFFLCG